MARVFIFVELVIYSLVQIPAAGRRMVLTLSGNVLTNNEISRACPLEPAEDSSGTLLQRATDQSPVSNRKCCNPGKFLFRCSSIVLKKGDKVKWLDSDEDIPPFTFGVVKKVEPPVITVKYPTLGTEHALHMSTVVKVSLDRAQLEAPPNPSWHCDCDMCSGLDGLFDVMRYEVRESPPEQLGGPASLFVHAGLSPKGLVQSLSEAMPVGPKYVLFLYPAEDPNQAFAFNLVLCERISCWHSRNYAVVMRSVRTRVDAWNYLKLFPDRSIHHLIVGGHGNAKQLKWSGSEDGAMKKDDRTRQLLRLMANKTKHGATVLFDACETAGETGFLGGHNFFTFASQKLFGRHVKGSKVKTHDYLWEAAAGADCLAADTVVFREDGKEVGAEHAAGYPRCKEIWPNEMEEFARAGRYCLSQCRTSCNKQTKKYRQKHKLPKLVLEKTGMQAYDRDGCKVGKKNVCRARWQS